ncbi:hypothetical protein [Sinomonas cellulolyticus]|uniref:hypothetical protein n=1 Tax=Sinomonas cellulolyticus TaxID=2801916 RepID=UPI0035ABD218
MLDKRLDPVERRCALMHELVHIEHGHTGCQGPRTERRVRHEAGRRLISPTHLLEAYRWTEHPEELGVTPRQSSSTCSRHSQTASAGGLARR